MRLTADRARVVAPAAYVDSVLSGATEPDVTVGRQLLDMVHSVPKMSQEQFDEMLNSNIKVGLQRRRARFALKAGIAKFQGTVSCQMVIKLGCLSYYLAAT